MDKAKEIYSVGKQRLVDADNIERIYCGSVPSNAKRFFCPSCGEYVTFVHIKKKGHKSYFRHCNINETTKMCDLRSKNTEQLSIYERVGLPLYLKEYSRGVFELYLAFYSIDKQKLNIGNKLRETIEIGAKSKKNIYYLNENNFSSDETVLKKLNFINDRYIIKYSSINMKKNFEKRWGNEVEGILSNGSLFSYGENGGKKVRINDDITTQTNYYYVGKGNVSFKNYRDIEQELLGEVLLNDENETYKVYRIKFIPKDEDSFNQLSYFCRKILKVSLIFNPPELIRLWPPDVIQGTDSKFVNKDKNSMCILKTDEDNPCLYLHYNNDVDKVKGIEIEKFKYLVKIPINMNRVSITIDRQYNSIVFIQNGYINEIKKNEDNIKIVDAYGNEIKKGLNSELPKKKTVIIKSENRCGIIHEKDKNSFLRYKIVSKESFSVQNIEFGDRVLRVNGNNEEVLLDYQKCNKKRIEKFNDNELYFLLKRQGGPIVTIPTWTSKVLIKIKVYPKTYNLVKRYMLSNSIRVNAINLLWKIYKEEE